MGMQVSYRFCTEISSASDIQRHQSRCRPDPGNIVQAKGDRNYRSGVYAGSYTYVGTNPTQIFRIRNSRVSEREKFAYDIRKTIFTFISELCFGYKGPGCSQFVNGLVLFQRKSV